MYEQILLTGGGGSCPATITIRHNRDILLNIMAYLKSDVDIIIEPEYMRFPTMWHFDMCRLGRASAAAC